jgi:hypothetical protein
MAHTRLRQILFSKPITWLLWLLLFVMVFLLAKIIIPSADFYVKPGRVGMIRSPSLNPFLLAFFVCLYSALAILGGRAWIKYVIPWWRGGNGA